MNKNTEKLINEFATHLAWRIYGPAIVAFTSLAIGLFLIALMD